MAPAFHAAAEKAASLDAGPVYFGMWGGVRKMICTGDTELDGISFFHLAGKVDCLTHRQLSERFEVKAYPTLIIMINGEHYKIPSAFYTRDEAGLLDLAERVQLGPLKQLQTKEDLNQINLASNISFVFVQNKLISEKTTPLFQKAINELFVATPITYANVEENQLPDALEGILPRGVVDGLGDSFMLVRLEKNSPAGYLPSSTIEDKRYGQFSRNPEKISIKILDQHQETIYNWMYENRLPSVLRMGPDSAGALLQSRRYLVLAILSPEDDSFNRVKGKFEEFASYHSPYLTENQRSQFNFAWIDGHGWANYVSQFNVSPNNLPRYVVVDPSDRGYWVGTNRKYICAYVTTNNSFCVDAGR